MNIDASESMEIGVKRFSPPEGMRSASTKHYKNRSLRRFEENPFGKMYTCNRALHLFFNQQENCHVCDLIQKKAQMRLGLGDLQNQIPNTNARKYRQKVWRPNVGNKRASGHPFLYGNASTGQADCEGQENHGLRECLFFGYWFASACGKYGCPNCYGEGLTTPQEADSE